MKNKLLLFCVFILVHCCHGDLYMHNPRGGNNRLNEESANRKNPNRLFDSQNNNRGGYNVGEISNKKSEDTPSYHRDHFDDKEDVPMKDDNKPKDDGQYKMMYFASEEGEGENVGKTFLTIEFNVQHGAGEKNGKLNANIIGQYRCNTGYIPKNDQDKNFVKLEELRNGNEIKSSQDSKQYDWKAGEYWEKFVSEYERYGYDFPMHESFGEYVMCRKRGINKHLFTAGHHLRHTSHQTRQNRAGQKYGMECPEERDYYPHWAPTKWIDAFYVGSESVGTLRRTFAAHSNNVKPRGMCVENSKRKLEDGTEEEVTDSIKMKVLKAITEEECIETSGTWHEYHTPLEVLNVEKDECTCTDCQWDYTLDNMREKVCFRKPPPMEFHQASFSKENHNGNTDGDLEMFRFLWKVPYVTKETDCVFRMRYNISTDDYNREEVSNNEGELPEIGKTSMLAFTHKEREENENNKIKVNIGDEKTLTINVNEDQFGRTFQDRSHVFRIKTREAFREHKTDLRYKNIYNLNVRGKRGNIVQVYPAVEYDFVPNDLETGKDDLVHIQWTGSNTHKNGRHGGDGQTGDAGQGESGTDRHNLVCIDQLNRNFPVRESKALDLCFSKIKSVYYVKDDVYIEDLNREQQKDLAVFLAYSGFYENYSNAISKTDRVDANLNKASPSFEGVVIEMKEGCTINFMCSRNNNFSNRSQKGKIKSGT